MRRFVPVLAIALILGIAGSALNLSSFGISLEENLGLGILFHLRGTRVAPPEVVIASIDRESARKLNLPPVPRKWPRQIFAKLVENLNQDGAAVIVFDLFFGYAHTLVQDQRFAKAIRHAGNVILCEYLNGDVFSTTKNRNFNDALYVERTIPPIAPLANAALGLAPFPLPKSAAGVNQFWTFKPEAGEQPTLPVLAFQSFVLDANERLRSVLHKMLGTNLSWLPTDPGDLISAREVSRLTSAMRVFFQGNSQLIKLKTSIIKHYLADSPDPKKNQEINSLISLYSGPESLFLDYYGPPRTIHTIPVYKFLVQHSGPHPDLKGKAVFIGLDETCQTDQFDGFHTVFSQPDGTDLSGVEIAATAFANLLENRTVRPLPGREALPILFCWGFLLGLICLLIPTLWSTPVIVVAGFAYIAFSLNQFSSMGSWFPLAIPLFIQIPSVFIAGIAWRHYHLRSLHGKTRKAFELYIPPNIIDQVIRDYKGIEKNNQSVLAAVLSSDAVRYTALAENMRPKELNLFLNRYYKVIFEYVKKYDGMISDVIGDSMLALWIYTSTLVNPKISACRAALDMAKAIDEFNRKSTLPLNSRYGLHYGPLVLGHLGGFNRYEYRPVGDIVNTASRIENLNKMLRTTILVSSDILDDTEEFVVRELGLFMLAGKQKPVKIFELIGLRPDSDEQQRRRVAIFAEAIELFRNRSWKEAASLFSEYRKLDKDDGASLVYINLCRQYVDHPPDENWNGLIVDRRK